MGNRRDRQREQVLQQQQAEDRRQQTTLIAQAQAPRPVETALDAQTLDWLKTTSGENGPFDVRNLKAMKPNLGLYDAASQRQEGERQGTGLFQLGAQNTNPMLGQLLRSQSDDQRQQAAAGGLENAFRLTDAQMRGSALPLLSLQQNRTMGLAGIGSNNANQSTNTWANFHPAPSFWQQLALTGVQAAGTAAACVTLDTLVSTPEGERPIGDIKEGEKVHALDHDGIPMLAEVINTRRAPSEVVALSTPTKTLVCTPEHVLQQFTGDMSETPIAQLKVGDTVLTVDGIELIESIHPAGIEDVVILKLNDTDKNYAFATGGFLSLDDYRTAKAAGA